MSRSLLSLSAAALASCAPAREASPPKMADAIRVERPEPAPAVTPPPAEANVRPPAARREAISETLHGVQVEDPWRWLEDERSPEVLAWMKAQDAYARRALADYPEREALTRRLTELMYVDTTFVPLRRADRLFFLKRDKDKEKASLRVREVKTGEEKVVLDPNGWSPDGSVSLGRWFPSWDGKKVAYQRKPNAADEAWLHVIDVDTLAVSGIDEIAGARYASVDWLPDSSGFHYEYRSMDPSIPVHERPGHVDLRLHRLGEDPSKDVVLRGPTLDPKTFHDGELSRDGKTLLATVVRGWARTDVFLKRLGQDKDFRPLSVGVEARVGAVAHGGDLYILSNEGAPRQRVLKAALKAPDKKRWKVIIPEDPAATLVNFILAGGHLLLEYTRDATSELRVATLDGKVVRTVQLPSLGTVETIRGEPDQDDAYFDFVSFTLPRQVYRTSIRTGEVSLWARAEVGIDEQAYEVRQSFYPSRDGTKIPLFLVHRKGLTLDGKAPTLLYAYGGFNVVMSPTFRPSVFAWVERGGVYALAALRGGGEYGEAWHAAGRMHNKQNVFDDFHAAAEHLIQQKVTSPERLAIYGGSNGGLLVGAAMTQRPELYGAVVCAVPLLDMVRYHRFGSGMTWVPEYGSADDPEQFRTLHAYSPYHHVRAKVRYPPLLMLAADRDDRVDPMHARKFVAAMENAGNAQTYLRIEMNAGHGGADQIKKAIEQTVDLFAFLHKTIGAPAQAASAR